MRMLHHALSLSTLFLITSGSRFVIAATLFRTSPKSYLDARSACDLLDRPAKCFPRRLDAELRTECLDDGRDDATDREDAALPGRLDPAVLGRRYECFSPTRASVTASVSVSRPLPAARRTSRPNSAVSSAVSSAASSDARRLTAPCLSPYPNYHRRLCA